MKDPEKFNREKKEGNERKWEWVGIDQWSSRLPRIARPLFKYSSLTHEIFKPVCRCASVPARYAHQFLTPWTWGTWCFLIDFTAPVSLLESLLLRVFFSELSAPPRPHPYPRAAFCSIEVSNWLRISTILIKVWWTNRLARLFLS